MKRDSDHEALTKKEKVTIVLVVGILIFTIINLSDSVAGKYAIERYLNGGTYEFSKKHISQNVWLPYNREKYFSILEDKREIVIEKYNDSLTLEPAKVTIQSIEIVTDIDTFEIKYFIKNESKYPVNYVLINTEMIDVEDTEIDSFVAVYDKRIESGETISFTSKGKVNKEVSFYKSEISKVDFE